MKTAETKIRQISRTQLPNMYSNGDKLERDDYAHSLVDEYVAFAGKRDFRDLIRDMSYLEVIYDSSRQPKLARR